MTDYIQHLKENAREFVSEASAVLAIGDLAPEQEPISLNDYLQAHRFRENQLSFLVSVLGDDVKNQLLPFMQAALRVPRLLEKEDGSTKTAGGLAPEKMADVDDMLEHLMHHASIVSPAGVQEYLLDYMKQMNASVQHHPTDLYSPELQAKKEALLDKWNRRPSSEQSKGGRS